MFWPTLTSSKHLSNTFLLSYAWLAHSSWRNNILEIFMLMVLVMRQSKCPAHQPRSQISFLLVSRGEDE